MTAVVWVPNTFLSLMRFRLSELLRVISCLIRRNFCYDDDGVDDDEEDEEEDGGGIVA